MKVLVISASPNDDGLTTTCATAAVNRRDRGRRQKRKRCQLNDLHIEACHTSRTLGHLPERGPLPDAGRLRAAARAGRRGGCVRARDAGLLGRDERGSEVVRRPAAPLRGHAGRGEPAGRSPGHRGGRGRRQRRGDDYLPGQHGALDPAYPGAHVRPDRRQPLEPRV